jgi:hypothetical protein
MAITHDWGISVQKGNGVQGQKTRKEDREAISWSQRTEVKR